MAQVRRSATLVAELALLLALAFLAAVLMTSSALSAL